MHPRVYSEFAKILANENVCGRVLEIGAVPNDTSLLNLPCLDSATEKIGLNLDGPARFADFEVRRGNANSMEMFSDAHFDVVLCNAVLEHDKHFWKTIEEIRRVTKPGGMAVIGVPGYVKSHHRLRRFRTFIRKVPGSKLIDKHFNALLVGSLTLRVHNAPGDYYRFGVQAFSDVFFTGWNAVDIRHVMMPPRIIGSARRP